MRRVRGSDVAYNRGRAHLHRHDGGIVDVMDVSSERIKEPNTSRSGRDTFCLELPFKFRDEGGTVALMLKLSSGDGLLPVDARC